MIVQAAATALDGRGFSALTCSVFHDGENESLSEPLIDASEREFFEPQIDANEREFLCGAERFSVGDLI
jgi:hypothetical protein